MPRPSLVPLGVVALDGTVIIASVGIGASFTRSTKEELAVIVLKIAPGGEVYR